MPSWLLKLLVAVTATLVIGMILFFVFYGEILARAVRTAELTDEADGFHPGVDIACAVGTPVLSTAAGTVISVAYDSVYGNVVVVGHSDSVTTVYGHNDSVLVEVGEKIMAGSRVALSGNTGISTAPHLHYEVRINEKPIDPLESLYYEKK